MSSSDSLGDRSAFKGPVAGGLGQGGFSGGFGQVLRGVLERGVPRFGGWEV
jgi:hypothetical protein